MNSHRTTETRVYAARNRALATAYKETAITVRPKPFQKTERATPPPIKAQNGDQALSRESLFRLLPDFDRAKNGSHSFILTDLTFKPLYANESATSILNFSGDGQPGGARSALAQRLRAIFDCERFSREVAAAEFVSGKRLYVCRPFLLESRDRVAGPPMVILLLERRARDPLPLSELSRQFHLSPRECETVRYLSQGLTTKEVAQHMSVSPNTVKQFVRLIMSKMGVTTRSGIVGKLVAG